jgi:hypothetical protein
MKKARISIVTVFFTICLILNITPITSAVRIIGSEPEHGERDVPVDTEIIIKFDETMDKISVENVIEIYTEAESESYQLIWSNNDKDLTIRFADELNYNQKYTIMLIGAQDTQGNSLENPSIFFETEEEESIDAGWILYSIIFLIIAFMVFLIGFALGSKKDSERE